MTPRSLAIFLTLILAAPIDNSAASAGTDRSLFETVIALDGRPVGFAVNSASDEIYVLENNSVSKYDGQAYQKAWNTNVSLPDEIVLDELTDTVYVTSTVSGTTVMAIDGKTGKIEDSAVFESDQPHGIALSIDSNMSRLYASLTGIKQEHGTIISIDTRSEKILSNITVADAGPYRQVRLDTETGMLYCLDKDNDRLDIIEPAGGRVINRIAIHAAYLFDFNPITRMIYVVTLGDSYESYGAVNVAVFNSTSTALVANVTARSGTPYAILADPSSNLVFITLFDPQSSLVVLDGKSNVVREIIPLPQKDATLLAASTKNGELYFLNHFSKSIEMLSINELASAPIHVVVHAEDKQYLIAGRGMHVQITSAEARPQHLDLLLDGGKASWLELAMPNELIFGITNITAISSSSQENLVGFEEISLNSTHSIVRFNVPDDTERVVMRAIHVVPEFPSLFLMMGLAAVLVVFLGRRNNIAH